MIRLVDQALRFAARVGEGWFSLSLRNVWRRTGAGEMFSGKKFRLWSRQPPAAKVSTITINTGMENVVVKIRFLFFLNRKKSNFMYLICLGFKSKS